MLLPALPSDVIILVLQNLSVRDLVALARTGRLMNDLVTTFGWTSYLRLNPRPSHSLSRARAHWPSRTQARYDFMTDHAWANAQFVARPLARPWRSKMQPTLVSSTSRMVVAAGPDIYAYNFRGATDMESPSLHFEGKFSFPASQGKPKDITGITFAGDAGMDQTLYVGIQDGTVHRVVLPIEPPRRSRNSLAATSSNMTCSHFSQLHSGDFVESLRSEKNLLLSLTSTGRATLTDLQSPDNLPAHVQLNARSWTSLLSLNSSSPYAAFGVSSTYPLRVHSITNGQISPTPSAILHTNISVERPRSSAVYGISQAPPASPWGSSPQVLVSGWFDGQVSCHDLRASSRSMASTDFPGAPAPLHPVLSLNDPLQLESIYSVSCGGGSASHIAAGSARHSVVSFWDVRYPRSGWSVHAPGNDPSPVYSIILESSRLYGATQSRPFVYDFGPWVSTKTYPTLPTGPGVDGLMRRKGTNEIGYYVTKYTHLPRPGRSSFNEN